MNRLQISILDKALATLSKSYKNGSEIDPDGLGRIHGLHPAAAEAALDSAVKAGKAYKTEDDWYGPSPVFCKEIADKVEENERVEAENRGSFFS